MYRFAISLFILLAVIASLLYFPSRAGSIAAGVLVLGLGVSIFSILRRQYQHYRTGGINRRGFALNSLVEIVGVLITLALSIFLARLAFAYLSGWVGGIPGLVLGILAAVLIGITISLIVQSSWGRLARKPGAAG